jgi:hypothetical protein
VKKVTDIQVVEGNSLPSKVFSWKSLLPRSFLPSTTETNEASGNGQESKNNQRTKKMVTSLETQVVVIPKKSGTQRCGTPSLIIIPGE